jgi:hypothetical protein
LSALAALGIDTITKKIQIKSVLLLCLIPFLLEVWQIKTPSVSVPLENSIPAVYKWIRRQPEPVIIAELPLSVFYHGIVMEDQLYTPYAALRQPDTYALETYRTYFSAYHKKRMINGYSGYLTDSYNKLAANLEGFPSDNSIQTLQHLGVTNIIVHLWQYDVKKQDEIRTALSESRLVTPVYFENNDVLYIISNNLD